MYISKNNVTFGGFMVLYVIETILFMLGGIGALLIGFEMLSNSITKIFHSQLKSLFNKTSSKQYFYSGVNFYYVVFCKVLN